MNRKTIALSLVLLCTIGAVMGALAVNTLAKADTNSTDTTSNSDQSVTPTTTNQEGTQQFGQGMMEQGFGGFCGGRGHSAEGMMGIDGFGGNYEVSSAYTTTINNILGNDTDTAALLAQGYNVTSIHPIVKSTINGDGTITTAASTAIVTLQNGTSGYSVVNVDVTNAKVTYIETVTRTVIDKGNS